MKYTTPDRILCSAIHFNDGKKYDHQPENIKEGFVVCGRRHSDCFTAIMCINGETLINRITEANGLQVQGFLTRDNKFVDRKEAAIVAYACGQISIEKESLYSEDLY